MHAEDSTGFPADGGEMGALIRRKDWSKTPLGSIASWSQSLRTAVATVLEIGFPCILYWGEERIAIHNDAYRPLLGEKSQVIGSTLNAIWPETLDRIRPVVEKAFAGESNTSRSTAFMLIRRDYPEEVWFDWCFSPLRDASGKVSGVLNIAIERTEQVRAERRHRYLLQLSDVLRDVSDPKEIILVAARMLGEFLNVDRTAYAELDGHQARLAIEGEWHTDRVSGLKETYRLSDFGKGFFNALSAGNILRMDCIPSASKRDGDTFTSAAALSGVKAMVTVPITTGDRLSAVLFVHDASSRHWTDEEVAVAQETANRTWATIENRKTERALAQSEEHFRYLANSMPQLVWTANPDGSVDYYNSRTEEFAGFRKTDNNQWEWQPVLHPDDQDATVAVWRRAIEAGTTYQMEHRVRMADGSYRWFLSRAIPMTREGKIIKWFGTATDIDDTKKNEEILRDTEAQRSAIIAHAPIGMYLVDSELRLREINPTARPVFAPLGQSLGGAYIGDVLLALFGKELSAEVTRRFKETHETGNAYIAPLFKAPIQAGEEEKFYDWQIHRVTLSDGGYGVVCYFIDVSAHILAQQRIQESEERFRTMADGLPLIVWVHDAKGEQEFVNQAFCEFFGVIRGQMKGVEWQHLLHPDDAEAYTRDFFECVQNCSPFHSEVRVRNAEGQWRQLESWGRPRFASTGGYLGFIGCSADITERASAEAALRKSEHELRRLSATLENRVTERTAELQEQTNRLRLMAAELASAEQRERKRLAALLHDDLQQLLVAASMQIGSIGRYVTAEEGKRAIAQASRWVGEAAQGARDLTRQLRPPALYEGGLEPALEWLASEMQERHGLEIAVTTDEQILSLSDDAKALLFECVRELLFNVIKYACVDRAAVRVWEERNLLKVMVADEGRGFDVASLALNGHIGGFGLFSIRERLTALGGGMTIESHPNQGTKVNLMVPLQEGCFNCGAAAPQAFFHHSRAAENGQTAPTRNHQVRVLVVDDHAMVREGVANSLAADPRLMIVGEAANGEEAIEAVRARSPDVVLMDLNMPRMNGIEATREILRNWPQTIVIGLSVQNDAATAKSMIDAGAAAFLSKEGDTEEMTATILRLAKGANRHNASF